MDNHKIKNVLNAITLRLTFLSSKFFRNDAKEENMAIIVISNIIPHKSIIQLSEM